MRVRPSLSRTSFPSPPRVVQNVAPREASVLFQMGKVLKKMGRTDEALACLCAALDLQPPSADSNLIRAAVERLKVADEQDGEEL